MSGACRLDAQLAAHRLAVDRLGGGREEAHPLRLRRLAEAEEIAILDEEAGQLGLEGGRHAGGCGGRRQGAGGGVESHQHSADATPSWSRHRSFWLPAAASAAVGGLEKCCAVLASWLRRSSTLRLTLAGGYSPFSSRSPAGSPVSSSIP